VGEQQTSVSFFDANDVIDEPRATRELVDGQRQAQ